MTQDNVGSDIVFQLSTTRHPNCSSICRIFNTDVGVAGNFSAYCPCLLQASAFMAGVRMKLLSDPSAIYPKHSLTPNHPVTCLLLKNISKQYRAKYAHILYYLCFLYHIGRYVTFPFSIYSLLKGPVTGSNM